MNEMKKQMEAGVWMCKKDQADTQLIKLKTTAEGQEKPC